MESRYTLLLTNLAESEFNSVGTIVMKKMISQYNYSKTTTIKVKLPCLLQ